MINIKLYKLYHVSSHLIVSNFKLAADVGPKHYPRIKSHAVHKSSGKAMVWNRSQAQIKNFDLTLFYLRTQIK